MTEMPNLRPEKYDRKFSAAQNFDSFDKRGGLTRKELLARQAQRKAEAAQVKPVEETPKE